MKRGPFYSEIQFDRSTKSAVVWGFIDEEDLERTGKNLDLETSRIPSKDVNTATQALPKWLSWAMAFGGNSHKSMI